MTARDSDGAEEHRQARPTIHARVVAVGDQCDAADLPTHPDPEDGHCFVADEADDGGEHHGPEKTDRLRVEKPQARLVERENRAHGYGDDDDQARKVLDAPQTVGEPPCGSPPDEHEGDAERDRGGRVGEVVDRVGEQRDAVRQHDDHDLQQRGDHQTDERPLQRPQATGGRGDRRVDHTVGMPMPVIVPVAMVLLRIVAVLVPVVMLIRHRHLSYLCKPDWTWLRMSVSLALRPPVSNVRRACGGPS
jgi:hypothetical protein